MENTKIIPKKINQTKINKFDDSGKQIERGNCYSACVAMLLGKDLLDVPSFELLPDDGSWYRESFKFFKDHGYTLNILHTRDSKEFPDGYSIASGPSPRGKWDHSVVYFKDSLYHDPYPNGNGIDNVRYFLIMCKDEQT